MAAGALRSWNRKGRIGKKHFYGGQAKGTPCPFSPGGSRLLALGLAEPFVLDLGRIRRPRRIELEVPGRVQAAAWHGEGTLLVCSPVGRGVRIDLETGERVALREVPDDLLEWPDELFDMLIRPVPACSRGWTLARRRGDVGRRRAPTSTTCRLGRGGISPPPDGPGVTSSGAQALRFTATGQLVHRSPGHASAFGTPCSVARRAPSGYGIGRPGLGELVDLPGRRTDPPAGSRTASTSGTGGRCSSRRDLAGR